MRLPKMGEPPSYFTNASSTAPYVKHLCSAGGGSGGLAAKDQAGNDIKASSYLKTHPAGDYSLAQGLKVSLFSSLSC